MSRRNTLSCFPIEVMSTGAIFEKHSPAGVQRASSPCFILRSLVFPVFVTGKKQENAAIHFCLAYAHYRMGLNQAILDEVLDNIEAGLRLDPTEDIKIGLLFLKSIALFQLAEEIKKITEKRLPSDEEIRLVSWTQNEFTITVRRLTSTGLSGYADLLETIEQIKEKTWPIFH